MLEFFLGMGMGLMSSVAILALTYKRFMGRLIKHSLKHIEIPKNEQVEILSQARLINYAENGSIHTAIMAYNFNKIIPTLGLKYIFHFENEIREINLGVGEYLIGKPSDYGITKIEIYNVLDENKTTIYDENNDDDTMSIWDLIYKYLADN